MQGTHCDEDHKSGHSIWPPTILGERCVRHGHRVDEGVDTMNTTSHITRYLQYLRSFGIAEAGNRVAELHDLDLGNIRFFAYSSTDGLRLKAAVTLIGMVTPRRHASDDWYGFLSGMPDAASAAERIAWLETDASRSLHGLPKPPVVALIPNRRPPVGIDPAQWAIVTAPELLKNPEGKVTLAMWILPSGTRLPERWIITTGRSEPAAIECILAIYEGAALRARKHLAAGTDDARWWALQYIGESGDLAAVPDVATLLGKEDTSPSIRVLAAGTLARLADRAAVTSLSAALRMDDAPEVRSACALALGRIDGSEVVQVLMAAATEEPDQIVRLEIVHALEAQGKAAFAALARIARNDPDAAVRKLARRNIDYNN